MKRCWSSCWGPRDDKSVRKRKRIDPVIEEARQEEIRTMNRRVAQNYLVLRLSATPASVASSNAVVEAICNVGAKELSQAIPMYLHTQPKRGLTWGQANAVYRPVRCVFFEGFRPHSTGCDVAFPYDVRTPLVQAFVALVRLRLLEQFTEITQVETLSPGCTWE
jgi:hypothetical protein